MQKPQQSSALAGISQAPFLQPSSDQFCSRCFWERWAI